MLIARYWDDIHREGDMVMGREWREGRRGVRGSMQFWISLGNGMGRVVSVKYVLTLVVVCDGAFTYTYVVGCQRARCNAGWSHCIIVAASLM